MVVVELHNHPFDRRQAWPRCSLSSFLLATCVTSLNLAMSKLETSTRGIYLRANGLGRHYLLLVMNLSRLPRNACSSIHRYQTGSHRPLTGYRANIKHSLIQRVRLSSLVVRATYTINRSHRQTQPASSLPSHDTP